MIIHVGADGTVQLRDANDFKSFKIVVARRDASAEFTASALQGIASVDPDGNTAWVSQQALRRWQGRPQPEDWLAAFDKMVDSVRRFGWVRDADQTVRAHIERADA
jgi:hypothetical protein